MSAITLASLTLWLAFQASAPAPPAEAAVVRFFAAVEAGDCETLGKLTARDRWRDRCPEAVKEMKDHGTRFLGIEGSQPDGRDPRTRLVRVRVHYSDGEHLWVLPVEPSAEGWRLSI